MMAPTRECQCAASAYPESSFRFVRPKRLLGFQSTTALVTSLLLTTLLVEPAAAKTSKVLIIGLDGVRPDSLLVAQTPNIDSLISNGTYSPTATTSDKTFSGPGWTDILFGVHRDHHRVITNEVSPNPAPGQSEYEVFANSRQHLFDDVMSLAKKGNPELKTARIVGGWKPLYTTQTPDGTDYAFQGEDEEAVSHAVTYLTDEDPDLMFLYFANPDGAGHAYGFHPQKPEYIQQLSATDAQIGEILKAIRSRPTYSTEDWLILMTADHGGASGGVHNGNSVWQRQVPFIVSGDAAKNHVLTYGAKNVDIVPTALAHLGLSLPSHLVGHVVGITPPPLPSIELNRNLLFNGDAEFDHGFDSLDLDQAVSGWNEFPEANFILETAGYNGDDSITVVEYGSENFPESGSGKNLFAAGGDVDTSMVQMVDLAPLQAEVDAGARFQLEAMLGAGQSESSSAVSVEWLDSAGKSLGSAQLAGETPIGSLKNLSTTGRVPEGARIARVTLSMHGPLAWADDVKLSLTKESAE